MTDTQKTPEQKTALRLYGVLGAALLMSLVPSVTAALFSMLLFVGLLIAAYVVRSGTDNGSFSENHMTFIIRTIWIGGFFSLVVMCFAAVYLFLNIDNTPLDPCIQNFLNQGTTNLQSIGPAEMMEIFRGCYNGYMDANFNLFILTGVLTGGPILIYFSIRFIRGLSRALKNYRVAQPKSWF